MSSEGAIVVNLNKRQYIDPDAFNDNTRLCDYLIGSHARAVAILVCEARPGIGAGRLWDRYVGSWSGDRIVAVSDAAPPNTYGVQTASPENPDRNLFSVVWKEFEDISYPMLILLCESDREFADALLSRTWTTNLRSLWHLGNALTQYRCTPLEDAVARRFGPDWKRLYQEQDIKERELAADDVDED